MEEQFAERARRLGEEFRLRKGNVSESTLLKPDEIQMFQKNNDLETQKLQLETQKLQLENQKLKLDVARLKLVNVHLLSKVQENINFKKI